MRGDVTEKTTENNPFNEQYPDFESYLEKLYQEDSTILDLKISNCRSIACSDCGVMYLSLYYEVTRKLTCAERLEKIINWCNDHPTITTLNLSGNRDIKEQELLQLFTNLHHVQNVLLVGVKTEMTLEIFAAAQKTGINFYTYYGGWHDWGKPNKVRKILALMEICGR